MTTTAFEVLEPPRFRDLFDAAEPDRAASASTADAAAVDGVAPAAKAAKKAVKSAKAAKKASKRASRAAGAVPADGPTPTPEPEPDAETDAELTAELPVEPAATLDEVVVDPSAQIPLTRLHRAAALAKEITTATDLVASGADPTNALALRRYLRALSREMDELVVRTGDEVAGP